MTLEKLMRSFHKFVGVMLVIMACFCGFAAVYELFQRHWTNVAMLYMIGIAHLGMYWLQRKLLGMLYVSKE